MSVQIGAQTTSFPSLVGKHAMASAHAASLPVEPAFAAHHSCEVSAPSHAVHHGGSTGAGAGTGAHPRRRGDGEGAPAGEGGGGPAARRTGGQIYSYKEVILGQRCYSSRGEGEPVASISPRVSAPPAGTPWLHSTRRAHLLSKFKGRCFRCLARDHQVSDCRNPVRCWICCRCGHTSRVCPSRRRSDFVASHKPLSTISDHWCRQPGSLSSPPTSSQHRQPMDQCTHKQQTCQQAYFLSKMQGLCFNCLAQDHRVAQCRSSVRCWWCYKAGHISFGCPNRHRRQRYWKIDKVQPSSYRRPSTATMWVPVTGVVGSIQQSEKEVVPSPNMLLEAELDTQQRSKKIELPLQAPRQQEAQGLTDNNLGANHTDGLQSPSILRSETEQLAGQQLIKVLSSLKHNAPLLSPSIARNTPFKKESNVVGKEGLKKGSPALKLKIKPLRPAFKVVRDMLTKKWIFIKEYKQLGDWSLQRFLNTYKKLSSTNNIVALRNLMEGIRKLTQISEKMKKKKRVLTYKPNTG